MMVRPFTAYDFFSSSVACHVTLVAAARMRPLWGQVGRRGQVRSLVSWCLLHERVVLANLALVEVCRVAP